ncbi:MAG: 3-isopropylmalate dehydratase large subunit [Deltaproteobacteria bacterium]
MGKTIAEKILSQHTGQDLRAGDFCVSPVDFCFGQDGTSKIIADRFRALGVTQAFDPGRFAMVLDHSAPAPNMGVAAVHHELRQFAKEYGLKLYDIGCGVCHQVIPEQGHVLPGDVVLGADSHTCTYGALGALATGVGSTDLAITLACGKNWFKVPESVRVLLKGAMPRGLFAKDIILRVIGDLGADGATYKSVEFYGKCIDTMSMDGRFTICNMGVEMGAKFCLVPPDKVTLAWVLNRNKERKPNPQRADKDASYCMVKEYDVSAMVPQLAKPHTVDNNAAVEEMAGTPIQEAFLGTCTNGRYEDLFIAARMLRGRRVHPDVRFIVAPASRDIYLSAVKRGIIATLVEAGASVVTPGCGPCVGTHNGVPSKGETVISTANRNFKGRMGQPDAFIYLASPATVVASALDGKITDPRKYLK